LEIVRASDEIVTEWEKGTEGKMPREKELFRDNLERLDKAFPAKSCYLKKMSQCIVVWTITQ
jgi:hypothetical protein